MKYRIEYFDNDESLHIDVIDAKNEIMIPFKLREKGIKDLKRVKLATPISDKEYSDFVTKRNIHIDTIPEVVSVRKKEKVIDSYEPSHGYIFIKNGEIGKQYTIGDVLYKLISVRESSVTVTISDGANITISPYSQAILFKVNKL